MDLLADPILILCVLGLLLLGGMLRRQWWKGSVLLGVVLASLYFLAVAPGAALLLRPLEGRYPALLSPPRTQAIVVLSGGENFRHDLPALHSLPPSTLARVVEGVRLFLALGGEPILWFVGGEGVVGGGIPLMAQAAWELGVPKEKLRWLTASRNTWEDAALVAQHLETSSFILVTSAFHLPRALRCFWAQGRTPIPAPCGHRAPASQGVRAYVPSLQNLHASALALREHLALFWYGLRYFHR